MKPKQGPFPVGLLPAWSPLALFVVIAVRAGLLLFVGSDFAEDPDDYGRLAVNWAEAGTFGYPDASQDSGYRSTAFRPPIYPWVLSWLVASGEVSHRGVMLLHVALGALTVWLTYLLARSLISIEEYGRRGWLLVMPALCVCIDPLLLRSSQLLMTETLAAFLACCAWLAWIKLFYGENPLSGRQIEGESGFSMMSKVLSLGGILGLSILTRPTAAPWAVALLGLSGLCSLLPINSARANIKWVGVASLIVASFVGSWTIRNFMELGKPIWATSHGGYTLLLANNPSLNEHFFHNGPSRNWDAEHFHLVWSQRARWTRSQLEQKQIWIEKGQIPAGQRTAGPRTEVEQDQLAYSLALGTIQSDVSSFLRNSIYRASWFWAAWPNPAENSASRVYVIGVWYAAIYVLAVLGAWKTMRQGLWPWSPAILMLLSLTAIHAIYWGNMRMRAPLMPMVYLLATQGVLLVVERWRGRSDQ